MSMSIEEGALNPEANTAAKLRIFKKVTCPGKT